MNRCLLIFYNEVEVAGCFCQMGSFAEEAIQPLSSENLLQENGAALKQEEGKWGVNTQQCNTFRRGHANRNLICLNTLQRPSTGGQLDLLEPGNVFVVLGPQSSSQIVLTYFLTSPRNHNQDQD